MRATARRRLQSLQSCSCTCLQRWGADVTGSHRGGNNQRSSVSLLKWLLKSLVGGGVKIPPMSAWILTFDLTDCWCCYDLVPAGRQACAVKVFVDCVESKLNWFNWVPFHSKRFGAWSRYVRSIFLVTTVLDWWVNELMLVFVTPLFSALLTGLMFYRKRSSWMARSSSLCYGAHVRWPTVISRSSRSTRSSTWPSGSCVSSLAPCRGRVCCVCGTCSSVKVTLRSALLSQRLRAPLTQSDSLCRGEDRLPRGPGAAETDARLCG